MRIIRNIALIFFFIILLLLAVSTIRIVVSGQTLGSMSFYTFMEFLQNDLDLNAEPFFNDLGKSVFSLRNALRDLILPTDYRVTGYLVIDKILSIFGGFSKFLIGLAKGAFYLVKAPLSFVSVVADFLSFIYHIIGYLFGISVSG